MGLAFMVGTIYREAPTDLPVATTLYSAVEWANALNLVSAAAPDVALPHRGQERSGCAPWRSGRRPCCDYRDTPLHSCQRSRWTRSPAHP